MELPSTVVFLVVYLNGTRRTDPASLVLLVIWLGHYAYRGFYFPWAIRTRSGAKATFSLAIVMVGWLSTSLHGYLNAAFITGVGPGYATAWLWDWRFLVGVATYYAGFAATIHSDAVVRRLRDPRGGPGEVPYRIPQGGLFEYVTNATYFGELVAWLGFALLTCSPGGVFIFLLSLANLLPRAVATHRWYLAQFPEYPRQRRVLVPFLF